MENLNIEAKNVKTFEGHDGTGYNASIYINGTRVAKAKDLADGAPLDIRPLGDKSKKIIKEAREYISTLPERECKLPPKPNGEVETFTLDESLELLIEDAVNDYLIQQDIKRLQKKGFVFRDHSQPEGRQISHVSYKRTLQYLVDKGYKERLQEDLDKYVSELTEDEEIVNSNLEELGLKLDS
jgi:hypothetical protein